MSEELARISSDARKVQRELDAEYAKDEQDAELIASLERRLEEIDEEWREAGGYKIS